MQSDNPTVIDTLVVHTDDVVTALEANTRRDADAVLRVTPPFSARMRARLHLDGREADYGAPRPLHVDPGVLVAGVPPFPTPDDTADRIREGDEYAMDDHREVHAELVEQWRKTVRERVADRATIATPAGDHEVGIALLG